MSSDSSDDAFFPISYGACEVKRSDNAVCAERTAEQARAAARNMGVRPTFPGGEICLRNANMADKDPYDRIWEVMQEVRMAMVVTHSGDGDALRSRPMAARPEEDDNAIYFLTDVGAPKDQEIADNAEVCLSFADPKSQRYVSVTGTAEVRADPEIVARVWSAADKAFWSDAQDQRIRVIRVTPDRGEYWEGPGFVACVSKMVAAVATGSRPKFEPSQKVSM
jgi:general stress protein 26